MDKFLIAVLSRDPLLAEDLQPRVPTGIKVQQVATGVALRSLLRQETARLLLVDVAYLNARELVEEMRSWAKELSIVLLVPKSATPGSIAGWLVRFKTWGFLPYPYDETTEWLVQQILEHSTTFWDRQNLRADLDKTSTALQARVDELKALYAVSRAITASLDLTEVLQNIVTAAVQLTHAEEGFILVHEGDRLYLRALYDPEGVRRLNTPVNDRVAWQVLESGQPAILGQETLVATGYLVRALLYVPMRHQNRPRYGVLGVVNRRQLREFDRTQLDLLAALADLATTALENARLYAAVTEEQTRLRSLLKHARELILLIGPDNTLELWSDAAEEAFLIPPEAQGQEALRVLRHPDLQTLLRPAPASAKEDQAFELKLADGRIFNAQVTDIDGVGRLIIMQDISHFKELDRLKSEFVFTVSHDLRTPLTAVQGYIDLLPRAGELTPQQQEFLKKAQDSLTYITALIGDLLEIGRIEAGYDTEMAPCQMDSLIQEVCEALYPQIQQAGLQLRWQRPAQTLWVQGNARRLRQVLENLLSNAIKYTPPGGWIEVTAHREENHILVSVRDTGYGIPPEAQSRLFERFYRVRMPETEHIPGIGLGLAIVKSIIEKHKGRIWVESTPGQGSTFSFILPALIR